MFERRVPGGVVWALVHLALVGTACSGSSGKVGGEGRTQGEEGPDREVVMPDTRHAVSDGTRAVACAGIAFDGSVVADEQSEVDALALYCRIAGDLTITGSVTDVTPLQNLASVGQRLEISFCDSLTTVSLPALRDTGSLLVGYNLKLGSFTAHGLTVAREDAHVETNPALTTLALHALATVGGRLLLAGNGLIHLDGFGALTSVGGQLNLAGNASLESLVSLSALETVGGLGITNNVSLEGLDGLSALSGIAHGLHVAGNTALTNLDGLQQLEHVGDRITIHNNPALTSLGGLSGVKGVLARELDVSSNAALTHLGGLDSISSASSVTISRNPALVTLEGLGGVARIEEFLRVTDNPALSRLIGLENLDFVGTMLSISNNEKLPACAATSFVSGVGTIGGAVTISGNLGTCP